jgi:hypothetical protein
LAAFVQALKWVINTLVANKLIPLRDGYPTYDLYGQSFSGILAFDELTAESGLSVPRSITLSNVPSSAPSLLKNAAALLADLGGESPRFDVTHVCRMSPRRPTLLAAYASGYIDSHWHGVDFIAYWYAKELTLNSLTLPLLLLTDEHDFVTLRSIKG